MATTNTWTRSRRDHALTALVEGFFGVLWFSWSQANLPAALHTILIIGSIIAIFAAIAGGVLSFRFRTTPAVADDQAARHRYNIIVAVEFGLLGLGALLLGLTGQTNYIPAWVCAVVGVHFFSLAPLLRDRSLYPLGVLLCITAIVALVVGLTTHVVPSTITSTGVGWSLTLFALFNLITRPAVSSKAAA